MLQLIDISKSFQRESVDAIPALDRINLKIERGSFTIIIGSNGSGKSTLLQLIAGTLFPDKGEILLNGDKIHQLKEHQRASWISRIHQDPIAGSAPDLTILENFRLAVLRGQRKGLKIGINNRFKAEVAERLAVLGIGLEDKLNHPVRSLSGGQRQALALIMAIYSPPHLLLLDEPTAALDPKSADLVMNMANEFIQKENLTTIMVTHHMPDAVKLGDRLIQLHQGHIYKDLDRNEKSKFKPIELLSWFRPV